MLSGLNFNIARFVSLCLCSLIACPTIAANTPYPDDGTYKTVIVDRLEECSQLCKSDPKCRGSIYQHPHIHSPRAECRLNNGFGSQPLFPPTPPSAWDLSTALDQVNSYRKVHSRGALRLNTKLTQAAQAHSDDISQTGVAGHKGSDGAFHDTRLERVHYVYSTTAENVAAGPRSWEAAFKAWQDSPGHNRNLLNSDMTEIGIALTYEPRTTYLTYWTMVLAAPRN